MIFMKLSLTLIFELCTFSMCAAIRKCNITTTFDDLDFDLLTSTVDFLILNSSVS